MAVNLIKDIALFILPRVISQTDLIENLVAKPPIEVLEFAS